MKLEEYDGVHLNREVEELAACGIHKGCRGVIIKLGEKRSLVLFYNPEDLGDYAYAWANNDDLEYYRKLLDHIKKEMMQKMATEDFTKKLRFEETHLREYDLVRVLVEKEQYIKCGVHKGMEGTILEPEKIDGGWVVYFSDETGADTIACHIKEKDLELVCR